MLNGYRSPSTKYLKLLFFIRILDLLLLIFILLFQNTLNTSEESYQLCTNNSIARKVVACKQS